MWHRGSTHFFPGKRFSSSCRSNGMGPCSCRPLCRSRCRMSCRAHVTETCSRWSSARSNCSTLPPCSVPMEQQRPNPEAAFSLVELLVAAAIGAVVIAATAIGFAVISNAVTRGGRIDVELPGNTHANLFGGAGDYITMWPNPNYAEAAKARLLRDKLMEDVSAATAVFALGRNAQWTNNRIAVLNLTVTNDLRGLAFPEGFRKLLVSEGMAGAATFLTNQTGPLTATNATIFVLGGLESQSILAGASNSLRVVATYEVDFVSTTSPPGTYASVRRYVGGNAKPTDYYHSFYPGEDNGTGGFRPLAVNFGRAALGGTYNVAPNHPFTFLWWPDPLVTRLGGAPVPVAGSPPLRSAYTNMAGRTSLFTIVPMFPGQ
ncbi:MAG: hypothetical protein FGM15_06595 [Chthoniobacterales bacterium]|nr:hypothetical protein [Chthoniobacterales bacterium]